MFPLSPQFYTRGRFRDSIRRATGGSQVHQPVRHGTHSGGVYRSYTRRVKCQRNINAREWWSSPQLSVHPTVCTRFSCPKENLQRFFWSPPPVNLHRDFMFIFLDFSETAILILLKVPPVVFLETQGFFCWQGVRLRTHGSNCRHCKYFAIVNCKCFVVSRVPIRYALRKKRGTEKKHGNGPSQNCEKGEG